MKTKENLPVDIQAKMQRDKTYAQATQLRQLHPNRAIDVIEGKGKKGEYKYAVRKYPTTYYGAYCEIRESNGGEIAAEFFAWNIERAGKLLIGANLYILS